MSAKMERREFIAALGGAAAAWPLAARAQQTQRVPRIGVLLPGTPSSFAVRAEALRQGLRDFGHVEGRTIAIEWRFAEEKFERLPDLASQLIALPVDIIVANGTPATKAAKGATSSIPIVMVSVSDPVSTGLVASLARPGGNVTGLSIFGPDLSGKRLELLKEAVAVLPRVVALFNPTNGTSHLELREIEAAARALNVELRSVAVSSPNTMEIAFGAVMRENAQAFVVLTDGLFFSERKTMTDLAAKHRLPGMYWEPEFSRAGGLMSYGPSSTDLSRRSAGYVDQIIKGARPADLPVQQPTKFELVINLRTAKALGLDIPPTLLARADEVIE
jgi:putative ABC transport system substrate-binding protein